MLIKKAPAKINIIFHSGLSCHIGWVVKLLFRAVEDGFGVIRQDVIVYREGKTRSFKFILY